MASTEVMMLVNMTTREELLDDEEFADIELDIQEECENFGKVGRFVWSSDVLHSSITRQVQKVVIPRPDKSDPANDPEGLGRIWVRFEDADACSKARQALGGRMFNNRKVTATFYSVEKFEAGLYE
jgi:splicing factor U2AF subunit